MNVNQTLAPDLDLTVLSRSPTRLSPGTVARVLGQPVPRFPLHIDRTAKRASVIVVTLNHLVFTRLCLESVLQNTAHPNLELVVVDNGSSDGTGEYLSELAALHPNLLLIMNDQNRGFAAANNQGLARASGEVLALLNNDTIAPRGWLTGLTRHLQDNSIGLVGPVTNRTCNEAQVDVNYRTYGEMLDEADARAHAQPGENFEIEMLPLFCAAMRREVYDRVDALDEQFQIGMFEDDDYSLRVRRAGYRVVCARDVFVHHFGQATLGELAARGEYGAIFHSNRRRFETKWQTAWQPHTREPGEPYYAMVRRIRAIVRETIPPHATIVVASKGDPALVNYRDNPAQHLAHDASGSYSGYSPATGDGAVALLETARERGGEFLLIPASARWWLDYYGEFAAHLNAQYGLIVDAPGTCKIFDLRKRDSNA